MRRPLAPAALLLGRLPLALKFLVVGLVLVVPLGVVVYAYVDTESGVVAFSAKERIGITTMSPLLRLMSDVADARHEAAIGERITVIPAQDIALAESAQ